MHTFLRVKAKKINNIRKKVGANANCVRTTLKIVFKRHLHNLHAYTQTRKKIANSENNNSQQMNK